MRTHPSAPRPRPLPPFPSSHLLFAAAGWPRRTRRKYSPANWGNMFLPALGNMVARRTPRRTTTKACFLAARACSAHSSPLYESVLPICERKEVHLLTRRNVSLSPSIGLTLFAKEFANGRELFLHARRALVAQPSALLPHSTAHNDAL